MDAGLAAQLAAKLTEERLMHFQIVLFGDASNGQSSIFACLAGAEQLPSDFKLEPSAKEITCESGESKYKISVIDAGEGLESVSDMDDDKNCFRNADIFVLVVDSAADYEIALENVEDRWLKIVADEHSSPHLFVVLSKADKFEQQGGDMEAKVADLSSKIVAFADPKQVKLHCVLPTSAFTRQGLEAEVRDNVVAPAEGSLLGRVMEVLKTISFAKSQ
eukprot:TRINITY_DN5343_c0_g1_i2.p1 TRINITY_DN5343_c0_g1~~TRINITY_DN5343_c0_g1_i2.p1  ORF type:complete len:219 (-),score=48.31 TRINITY_DN5343_c0_g1_i2:333-989(-)